MLVLGAVRRRDRAHGYQVRSDLESWGAHEWATATSGSVYHALKAMTGQDLLVLHETVSSEAGGPPRMEYEITAKGEQSYFTLLRKALASRDPRLDMLAAAVGLIEDLTRAEAIGLLRQRAEAMRQWPASIIAHLPPDADLDGWSPVGWRVRPRAERASYDTYVFFTAGAVILSAGSLVSASVCGHHEWRARFASWEVYVRFGEGTG
ncbi:PadR family transcriptional regulator [Amycolatopsis coloradensis]|uniref:PadR family transcriptional regulator n=1 Tax=Amycolatopsis coloradensis TaxID=76021 RepID=A0ACD5BEB4_9PSEU